MALGRLHELTTSFITMSFNCLVPLWHVWDEAIRNLVKELNEKLNNNQLLLLNVIENYTHLFLQCEGCR